MTTPTPGNSPSYARLSTIGPAEHEVLLPPPRGDGLARRWWMFGVVSYFGLGSVFFGTLLGRSSIFDLIGLGDSRNYALFVLIAGGLLLTLAAMWHGFEDIRVMTKEEVDIQWLVEKGSDGVGLVFADARTREGLFKSGKRYQVPDAKHRVETIVDHRVWRARVSAANSGMSTISGEAARAIAEKRIARLGSFTRYTSSLLLLLAVVGTFAGVKTALPDLIEAVKANPGSGVGLANLEKPLKAVADAFGGNALALIGAIAIGLIAQGIGAGRRNLLERLELVSEAYIYDQNVMAGDDNPMTRAIVELRTAAVAFAESTGRLQGIETGLAQLGAEFKGAISTLENRLADVVERDQGNMYDRTSAELSKLHATVTSLASATRANADLYGALVDRVGDRSRESQAVIESFRDSSNRLAQVLDSMTSMTSTSRTRLDEIEKSAQLLGGATIQVQNQVTSIRGMIESVVPALDKVEASFTQGAERLAGFDLRASEAWRGSAQTLSDAVSSLTEQQRTALKSLGDEATKTMTLLATQAKSSEARVSVAAPSAMNAEMVTYLRAISQSLEEQLRTAPSKWLLILLPTLGFVLAAAAVAILT